VRCVRVKACECGCLELERSKSLEVIKYVKKKGKGESEVYRVYMLDEEVDAQSTSLPGRQTGAVVPPSRHPAAPSNQCKNR
jgi:hypothetical protein